MKNNMAVKFKIAVAVMLVLIVAGMAIMGFLGLNNTADFTDAYEVQVGIDQNLNGSSQVVDAAARDYFNSIGAKVSHFATQTLDDGATYVYKLNTLGEVNKADLKAAVDSAISASEFSTLVGSVEVYKTAFGDNTTSYLYVLLALGVAVAVYFIYSLISEKVAGGVAVLCSTLASALIYLSIVAVSRIPEGSMLGGFCAAAIAFGGLLSATMCNKFKEIKKLAQDEKISSFEIATRGTKSSVKLFNFVLIIALVAAIALIVGGFVSSLYLAVFGAHIIAAVVSAYFAAIIITPAIWAAIKANK